MKLFLQDTKNLARKNCKMIFLRDLIKILQAGKLFCKTFLQDSCKIFHILQEKLHY